MLLVIVIENSELDHDAFINRCRNKTLDQTRRRMKNKGLKTRKDGKGYNERNIPTKLTMKQLQPECLSMGFIYDEGL